MTADDRAGGGFSLKRWSQRKLAAARSATVSPVPDGPVAQTPDAPVAATPATPGAVGMVPDATVATASSEAPALPPIESLTIESDFTGFLQPKVAEGLKRKALKQLFRDPHFNAMDRLDVYIDDYSLPDPIAPELVRELVQSRYIFDPPPTRVTAQGVVEDVPPEELAKALPAAAPERLPEPASDAATVAPATPAPDIPSAADVRLATAEPESPEA